MYEKSILSDQRSLNTSIPLNLSNTINKVYDPEGLLLQNRTVPTRTYVVLKLHYGVHYLATFAWIRNIYCIPASLISIWMHSFSRISMAQKV